MSVYTNTLRYKGKEFNQFDLLVMALGLVNLYHNYKLTNNEIRYLVSKMINVEIDISKSNQYKLVQSLTEKGFIKNGDIVEKIITYKKLLEVNQLEMVFKFELNDRENTGSLLTTSSS